MKALRALAAMAAMHAGIAAAATYQVDDSLSLPNESSANMKWRSLAPSRQAGNALDGSSIVTVRLKVAPWTNRNAKIYLALPEQPIGTVTAAWSTQGKLLPGELVSGNRTLVYAGVIRAPMIEDTIVLKLTADGRRMTADQRLQFHFEIDVD